MAYPYQSYQNPWQQGYYPNPYYPQQQMQQVQQQPQPQQTATQVQTSGIIWVRSDEEAAMYPVAPNTAVRLWHSSQPIVYFKQADASGRPSMKAYTLVERTQEAQESVSAKTDETTAYATKEEIDHIMVVIEAMKSDIKMLRKKKKVEEDDDE